MGRRAAAPIVRRGVLIPATAALLAAIGRRALLVRGAAFGQLATAVRRVAAVVVDRRRSATAHVEVIRDSATAVGHCPVPKPIRFRRERKELRLFLEDLTELKEGHRAVSEDIPKLFIFRAPPDIMSKWLWGDYTSHHSISLLLRLVPSYTQRKGIEAFKRQRQKKRGNIVPVLLF